MSRDWKEGKVKAMIISEERTMQAERTKALKQDHTWYDEYEGQTGGQICWNEINGRQGEWQKVMSEEG